MEEIAQGTVPVTEGQPAPTPPADFTNVPALSDADVRRAIEQAESKGIDPNALTVSEMADFQKTENPAKPADSQRISPDQVFNPNAVRLEVPDQFRGKDGEADVEKIKASTEELQKATKEKEEAIQKSVDDYLKEYKEAHTKFRNTPNPEKFEQRLREQAPPTQTAGLNDQQLREMIMNDYRVDPIGTTAQLIDAAIARHLEPFSEEKRERSLRANVESLAKNDPRVLDSKIYRAINAELQENPKLWNLDNPYEYAYLKVKDRLRLGEAPARGTQAPPSRPPSPVLGAGAPPSSPSPSEYKAPKAVLETLDIRDRKQEALGDEMLRRALERKTY